MNPISVRGTFIDVYFLPGVSFTVIFSGYNIFKQLSARYPERRGAGQQVMKQDVASHMYHLEVQNITEKSTHRSKMR